MDGAVTMEECEAKMAVPWAEASKKNMPRPPHQFDLKEIEDGDIDLWRCPNVPLKVDFLPVEQEGLQGIGNAEMRKVDQMSFRE